MICHIGKTRLAILFVFFLVSLTSAAVFSSVQFPSKCLNKKPRNHHKNRLFGKQQTCAFVIPGDSIVETTVVDGTVNFLSLYNFIITARVLLSWFPQAQGQPFLRPIYTVTDPYLNVFRRLPLQFGGFDFSILPAFFLLSISQNAVASLAAEIPKVAEKREQLRKRLEMRNPK